MLPGLARPFAQLEQSRPISMGPPMLCHLPTFTADLATMLADLGQPSSATLGRALGVTDRTARRWIATGQAPRAAMLAIFWVTRWGSSQISAHAENGAAIAHQLARALGDENKALRVDLARVLALGDTGASNAPSWRALPLCPVLPFATGSRPHRQESPRS